MWMVSSLPGGITHGLRTPARPAALIAVAIATLATASLAAPASAAPAGAGKRAAPKILSPAPGARLPARPVAVRVRAKQAGSFSVRLNGQAIGSDFTKPSRRGVRRLTVTASYGLRHGPNHLRVRVTGKGGKTRKASVAFQVRRNGPLAGPGTRLRIPVGSGLILDGSDSRSHLRRPKKLRHRWKIVKAPRGGRHRKALKPHDKHRGVRRHKFSPEVPGRYKIRLTVTAPDGRVGSAAVPVRVDPTPMVHVDTMATKGSGDAARYGIEVGEDFYAAKDPATAYAQLVALERKTLEPVKGALADLANKTYTCDRIPSSGLCSPGIRPGWGGFQKDLGRLGDEHIAILATPSPPQYSGGFVNLSGLESAAGRLGVGTTPYDSSVAAVNPGSFSAVGIPGTPVSEGDWSAVSGPGNPVRAGRMEGFFVLSNEGAYRFVPSERIDFTTHAAGSSPTESVIEVGEDRYVQSFPGGLGTGGGFHVVTLDPHTLKGESRWFGTDRSVIGELDGQLSAMVDYMRAANSATPRKIVIVASAGNPVSRVHTDGLNEKAAELVGEIARLGGTRTAFYTMLDPGMYKKSSYSLVSLSRSGSTWGHEELGEGVSGTGDGPLNTTPLTGTFARTGPNYTFEVQTIKPEARGAHDPDPSQGVTDLHHALFDDPIPWPEEGHEGREAAVAWIGEQVLGIDDPRGMYWTLPFVNGQFDFAGWERIANRIAALTYDSSHSSGFTAGDLAWAKDELVEEIGWLESTHTYLGALATPFAEDQLRSWAQFSEISNTIRDRIGVSPDQKLRAVLSSFFNFYRAMFNELPEPSGALAAAVNDVYEVVATFVEVNEEPAEDDFQTRADKLGDELAKRLQASQATLNRGLPNMVASDYSKLKAVGSCASTDPKDWPNCPFEHVDWQYTQQDQANAAGSLLPAGRTWAYSELLPARYNAYRLPKWWRKRVGGNEQFYGITGFTEIKWYPFESIPASAETALPLWRNMPGYGHRIALTNDGWASYGETWQIVALGYLSGEGTLTSPWVMHYPEEDVMKPLFEEVDKGGLGADREYFFVHSFNPKSLDHYPERDTLTGWCPVSEFDACPE